MDKGKIILLYELALSMSREEGLISQMDLVELRADYGKRMKEQKHSKKQIESLREPTVQTTKIYSGGGIKHK